MLERVVLTDENIYGKFFYFSVVKGYSPIQERVFVAGGRLPDPKSFEIFQDLIKCEFE